MKKYIAWSLEHEGRFWKYNDLGYTTFLELAKRFTEEEIRERQKGYPPNFLPMQKVGDAFVIPDCNEVVISVDREGAIEFITRYNVEAFDPTYCRLVEYTNLNEKEKSMLSKNTEDEKNKN